MRKDWRLMTVIAALAIALTEMAYGQAGAPSTSHPVVKRVIVHAGRLLDVKTGRMLADQVITIAGEKIVSVGPASQAAQSAGATTVNLPNLTVLPGLMWLCVTQSMRASCRVRECW